MDKTLLDTDIFPTCGKVESFELRDENIECVECGATIEPGQQACPACGWTWIESDD
jgi:predicted amidophosphoribosyltransferase